MRLLLSFGALLWVASRVHVTVWVLGQPVAHPSVLALLLIAVCVTAAGAWWVAARSVFGLPFWPRHLGAVAW